tara:strand:- start:3051 stop:3413 length:363 start_codon:yes stop_codon:yes gene_type:complete
MSLSNESLNSTRHNLLKLHLKSKGNILDDITEINKYYDKSKNIKSNKMNKYQYTSILGMRATQIEYGAEPRINITDDMKSALEVAEEELRQRKTPFIVVNKINNSHIDLWKIEDMEIYTS